MKLLGRSSSINVRKVLWTCAELGITLDHEEGWGETQKTADPEFRKLNPKALIPVLIDRGFILTESNAICRYLANKSGSSHLYPNDNQARARIEEWMDWQATDLNSAYMPAFLGRVRKKPEYANPEMQELSVTKWNKAMSLLNDHLTHTGPFVCGADFTLADIVLALSTHRWQTTPIERIELSAVENWMTTLSTRPAFHDYCQPDVP